MQLILIIGAGGHAQVVADILLRMRDAGAAIDVIGYLDDDPALHGKTFLELPMLGALNERTDTPHDAVIVAIGDNDVRRHLFTRLHADGEAFITAVHPSAVVAPDVTIGAGAMICASAVVNPGSVVGANTILNTGCTVDHHNRIGDHVHIAPGVNLGGDVTIGDGTLIGIGATVMPQCHVGSWSVVAAGAVAHRDVPDRVTAAGVPVRVIRRHDDR